MQTIEQMRTDPRPLVSLSHASAMTGEPLGSLLTQLADKDTLLFLRRPDKARIYCVTPSLRTVLRDEEYPESIIEDSNNNRSNLHCTTVTRGSFFSAFNFNYLALTKNDYFDFTHGLNKTSITLFDQAANIENKNIISSSAHAYIKNQDKYKNPLLKFKAKFACYFSSSKNPTSFNIESVPITIEDTFISRESLFDLFEKDKKISDEIPPELRTHLQPWKSDFLKAMNTASYKIFSDPLITKVDNISTSKIKEALLSELIKKESDSKTSPAATLLRHDHLPMKRNSHFISNKKQHYPNFFSFRLIYLNEKCAEIYNNYLSNKNFKPPKTSNLLDELINEGIIPENTARRIAGEIKPNYKYVIDPDD